MTENNDDQAPGTAPQDFEYGVLNPVSSPLVNDPMYNTHTSGYYNTERRLQKDHFTVDAFENRNTFRAIVLRVENPGGEEASSDPSLWTRGVNEFKKLAGIETAPKTGLQVLKVMVPELHPAPNPGLLASDNTEGVHQGRINNFYPTVVAESNLTPPAAPGDVVYIEFTDADYTRGIYIAPVIGNPTSTTEVVGVGGSAAFAANSKLRSSGAITPGTGDAVQNALDEWKAWRGRHEKEWENNPDLRARLIKYWKSVAGNRDDQWIIDRYMTVGAGKDGPEDTKSQWSAAFITYVMRDDPSFKKLCRGGCGGHFNYINGAMVNRFTSKSGWMTFLVSEWQAAGLSIQPGMLICSGHCDLVVDADTMIGGNTLNTTGDGFRRGADTAGRMPAKINAKRRWLMKKVQPGEKIPPLPSDMEFQQKGFWNNKCGKGKNTCKTVQGYLNHNK